MSETNSHRVLEDKVKHLECYVLQQNKMQEALKSMLDATVHQRGENYFRALVSQLARLLDVKYALVSELIDQNTAKTLALWAGDSLAENIVYSLTDSPCENVVNGGFCVNTSGVRQKYPRDQMLVEMGVESYIGTPLMDTHGKPIGILALFDDKPFEDVDFAEFLLSVFGFQAASEIFGMRVERELRESRDQWESSFNAIEDLVTIQDADMHILRANSAAAKYLGVGVEYLIGKYCYEVFTGRSEPCEGCPEIKTLRDKKHHTGIIIHEHTGRKFLLSTSAILDEHGELRNIVHVAKDITVQKELEEELYQARKMEAIGTLAGGIAHDFNNILTTILGYAELLKDDIIRGRAGTEKIDKVIQGSLRARDLVSQILTFSRRSIQKPLPLKPHLIVNESLKLLRSSIPSTVEIEQDIDKQCSMILADPTKLQQVLMNLSTNALQAMKNQKGTLRVSLLERELTRHDLISEKNARPGDFVELTVSDTGQGIEEANLKRIFEPYFTTRGTGRGLGLGLSLVHGIVRDHGGVIKVETEVGKGSTFRIYFPAVKEAVHQLRHNGDEELPTGSERILLVDDEVSIVEVEREGLERLGYRVQICSDSQVAYNLFCANPMGIDLIITDQTMPGFTGVELAEHILNIRKDMPIILCTGYSEVVSEQQAKKLGIREFLLKPIELSVMARAIRNVLDTNSQVK